jgi:hypothetical protein
MDILRAIEIRAPSSFGGEVKLSIPCNKILLHVKNSIGMNRDRENLQPLFDNFVLLHY